MKEIWRDIKEYEGLYKVSNLGRVKTLHSGKNKMKNNIKKFRKCHDGYYRVNLYKEKHIKSPFVHRLVAQAFIPNPNNYSCINHKDENKLNNNVNNLEWCTKQYNNKYSAKSRKQHRIILQYSKDNIFIREWPNISNPSKELSIYRNAIWRCCNGTQKTAGGYIWRYAEK